MSRSVDVTVIRAITNLRAIAARCKHKSWDSFQDLDELAKETAVALDNVAVALDALREAVAP